MDHQGIASRRKQLKEEIVIAKQLLSNNVSNLEISSLISPKSAFGLVSDSLLTKRGSIQNGIGYDLLINLIPNQKAKKVLRYIVLIRKGLSIFKKSSR